MCKLGTMIKTHTPSWKYGGFLLDRSIYLFIYLMKLTFIMILSFLPYRTNFLPAKKFNRTLHLRQTFQLFLPHLHGTDESCGNGWNFIYHLPMRRALLWQIQNGVFQLSNHASMQPRLLLFKKLKWSCCSLRAGQVFDSTG